MGIAVLYGSSRRNGNSDTLADLLVKDLDADKNIYCPSITFNRL